MGMLRAHGVGVEVRCRVDGIDDLNEEDACSLMEAAATELEMKVPDIGPIVFIEPGQLCAIGTFEAVGFAIDEAQAYTAQMGAALRKVLQEQVTELSTVVRELVPA
jgi:hypothetical protein